MESDVLKRAALVLNRNWQPVRVTTVERALVLLFKGAARVVEPADFQLYGWHEWAELEPLPAGPCIRTARGRLRVPEVVCLGRFDRLPGAAVTFSRRNVAKRDHHTCQYCGVQPGWESITIDHIIPRSQGGPTSWSNCVAACIRCNANKANRTPDQAGMKLRRKPTRPEWHPLDAAHMCCLPSWAHFVAHETEPALAGGLMLDR